MREGRQEGKKEGASLWSRVFKVQMDNHSSRIVEYRGHEPRLFSIDFTVAK